MRISDGSADVCSSDLMSRDFLRFIKEISDDADIRVAILTGAGRAFCVGGDLSLEDSFTGLGFQRELELYAETVLAILSCPKPIICQLNGDAVGWGATIALFCDIIVAKSGARLGDKSEEHTSELQSLMRISYAVF